METVEFTKEQRKEIEMLAKKIYKELYPDTKLLFMSGYSPAFERYKKLAERIYLGEFVGDGFEKVTAVG